MVTVTCRLFGDSDCMPPSLPELVLPPAATAFQPTQKINKRNGILEVVAEYMVRMNCPGVHMIEPQEFTFYDPKKEEYTTLETLPCQLTVEGTVGTVTSHENKDAPVGGNVSSLSAESACTLSIETSNAAGMKMPWWLFWGCLVGIGIAVATSRWGRNLYEYSYRWGIRRSWYIRRWAYRRIRLYDQQDDSTALFALFRTVFFLAHGIAPCEFTVARAMEHVATWQISSSEAEALEQYLYDCLALAFDAHSSHDADFQSLFSQAYTWVDCIVAQARK